MHQGDRSSASGFCLGSSPGLQLKATALYSNDTEVEEGNEKAFLIILHPPTILQRFLFADRNL